jgi:hypothetical protein
LFNGFSRTICRLNLFAGQNIVQYKYFNEGRDKKAPVKLDDMLKRNIWRIGNLIKKAGDPIPHRETPAGMKNY